MSIFIHCTISDLLDTYFCERPSSRRDKGQGDWEWTQTICYQRVWRRWQRLVLNGLFHNLVYYKLLFFRQNKCVTSISQTNYNDKTKTIVFILNGIALIRNYMYDLKVIYSKNCISTRVFTICRNRYVQKWVWPCGCDVSRLIPLF